MLLNRARVLPGERVVAIGANGAVGMCLVQVAATSGAEVVAVTRQPMAAARLGELGARHVDVATVADQLNPRGRIVLIAGHGSALLDLRQFYTQEVQLLSFMMSRMTVPELATAAAWINATHAAPPLTVSVGQVLPFSDAARAHALLESAALPHMPDGTVGRLVLTP